MVRCSSMSGSHHTACDQDVVAFTCGGAAQEERERVTLLAGQRRSGIYQPGDEGIEAGLIVVFRVPVVVGALVVLAMRGRGRA